jgi:hypothetical protein
VNISLEHLLDRFERSALEREVEEELQFHIEMQARDYERQGLTPEEAFAKAALRFGDFGQIKMQCMRIGKQNGARTVAMRILFTVAFLLGVLIRILSSEFHVTRVGDLLIMISVFGGLLLYAKRSSPSVFRTGGKPFQLGLNKASDSMPLSFDDKGRTPFERARADDQ